MKYLHTMVRVTDIEQSLRFYRDALGLVELSRKDYSQVGTPWFSWRPRRRERAGGDDLQLDPEPYDAGRKLRAPGLRRRRHLWTCQRLMDHASPSIGRARRAHGFVARPTRFPSNCCSEGGLKPVEPWTSMPTSGPGSPPQRPRRCYAARPTPRSPLRGPPNARAAATRPAQFGGGGGNRRRFALRRCPGLCLLGDHSSQARRNSSWARSAARSIFGVT